MSAKHSEADVSRFWSKVTKDGPTPDQTKQYYKGLGKCWSWNAGKFTSGYGQVFMGRKNCRAHRVSYELSTGDIPAGSFVIHACDNRACVNPAHLRIATHMQNVEDRDTKGRNRPPSGDDHYARRRPELVKRGADHPLRKRPELAKRGAEHYNFGNPRKLNIGEGNPHSKITGQTVLDMRKDWESGGWTQRRLAVKYRVSFQRVNSIVLRKSWRHI